MKSQLFYLVATGPVNKSNGGTANHSDVICSFTEALTPEQVAMIGDALGCAFLALVSKPEFELNWQEEA